VESTPPADALHAFHEAARRDAESFLDGRMQPVEFAGSVWSEAGRAALRIEDANARSEWLGKWVRFAHLEDEIDDSYPSDPPRLVIETLEQEARQILAPSSPLPE
jgi:hypothetical protein